MSRAISKVLKQAVSFNPTKETRTASIMDLCDQIMSEDLVLPAFQTALRWTLEKSIALLNYQLVGKAPVAPISINIIVDERGSGPQVTFIERKPVTNTTGKQSVNDGQQRLTCNFKAYSDHPDFQNIVLDLSKGKFDEVHQHQIKENQIPVGKLLNKDNDVFMKYVNENMANGFEVLNTLVLVRNKIFGYNYTLNFAKGMTEEEQVEWFDILNLAGSRVPSIQMRLSRLQSKGIDIYGQYTNKFVEIMESNNLGDLIVKKETEVSIPIATLNGAYEKITGKPHTLNYSPMPSDTKESLLVKLSVDEIQTCINMTLKGLNQAIEVIEQKGLGNPERIDYISDLSAFFAYIGNRVLSANEMDKLIEWYNTVDFNNKSNTDRRESYQELLRIVD
ncbi:MAG: hypothetical protein ACE3JK_10590 [Sporolactobacillus sp.]